MVKRWTLPLLGRRYCGDLERKVVHDLENEDRGPQGCRIEKIIAEHSARIFSPDTLEQARKEGYGFCRRCIEEEYAIDWGSPPQKK